QLVVSNASGSVTSAPASLSLFATPPAGTVVAVGGPTPPAGLTNIIAVAASPGMVITFSLALRSDGTIAAWGDNMAHQCDVPADVTNVTAIAAGTDFGVAVKSNGTIVRWGNYPATYPETNFIAVSARSGHAIGLRDDGMVVELGVPGVIANVSNIVAISAGPNYGIGVRNDGTVAVWGSQQRPITLTVMGNIVG